MIKLKNFQEKEFTCKHCGKVEMDDDFLLKLDEARDKAGTPFIINSGYRCIEHDKSLGGDGNHPQGKAADIKAINGWTRFKIIHALLAIGFQRIGIGATFVHVDDVFDRPRPCIWLYEKEESK